MNEQIKKLAEEASHQSPDGYPVNIPYSKDFAKKFAELIVSECLDIIDIEVPGMIGVHAMKKISEHFGIE